MFSRDNKSRSRKHVRVRKKVSGTAERPRLCVYRSLSNIYAQVIDDTSGVTLAEASTLSKELGEEIKAAKGKVSKSKIVGKLVAKKAQEKGIKTVVFDRGGLRYHGRIQAVAEGAREGGLKV
ncbi:MAG: 50S ribosomal protein L18 [Stygiobacter sp. RIFOXYC12_FULL_38_8]|nr:MAG: 50S ribosomal protein L18 [Stygiobacter sp. GWC2_38_9]OGU82128.1 MAG: 50S ribosomal protein L18 [Stygiobacter sp. RIFOXYA12_FULL_38_9]OGV08871.1 MAG: 50S ribosomal protein L18 [Stygiobacter sp. RIFOXYB2_FULL_37_11]OGV15536.1 MAG: 50S ribosomal protein L18 [Stygiobacter sp. RIFOXYC2_FULL_38_25]OGV16496.1 MAG: 50S ribosomal protein L18 [Stygiobacter sp. RIFOXYA2_FULL_38_8]OGV25476.1 MAG: 50S ribosomal protein L18 [Stygiobacter sp. RIFOXYC12_FULL_38_8]OGV80651.1 MAG: 50S ribosomal protei